MASPKALAEGAAAAGAGGGAAAPPPASQRPAAASSPRPPTSSAVSQPWVEVPARIPRAFTAHSTSTATAACSDAPHRPRGTSCCR